MNKKIIAILLLVCLSLSGCSTTQTGIDQLMSPPKLSEQQSNIYSALEMSGGKNMKLKYPKKGEYTSAFLINNLDSEPTEEAIVFYEIQNAQNASLPLRISVLDQRDGKWVSTYETGVEASEVEKVSFVETDEIKGIIVGFNQLGQKEKLIKQYNYVDGKLNEVSSIKCNNYEVFDLNNDNVNELITISAKSNAGGEQNFSTAGLYRITANGFILNSRTAMDPTVSEYINVNGGKLRDGKPALYLDGVKSATSVSTEILTIEDDSLVNLIYNHDDNLNTVDMTTRSVGLASLDFTEKGVYYIPNTVVAPGYEIAPKHQTYSFTQWYAYENHGLSLQQTSYVDYKLGFIFTLPESWLNAVTIEKLTGENEVVFYRYKNNASDNSEKVLSIRAIKKTDYNKSPFQNTHRILKDNGQLMYLYHVYDDSTEIGISEAQVRKCFNLLQGGSSNEKNPGM